ncbi:MAG: hypothetical protein R3220_04325 [Balneolaceae bacterium]|nr:hypothetical protein [Balneolaceae bacterium]
MELSIDKKRIAKTIDELPEDATVEEAIERLVLLHKVQIGLNETGEKSQEEIEAHFKKRRENRTSDS